jgi:hypothetical protein
MEVAGAKFHTGPGRTLVNTVINLRFILKRLGIS